MKFHKTKLANLILVTLDKKNDFRGFFARTWCANEFAAQGLSNHMMQDSIAYNKHKGTLRGLHYHKAPFQQARLVRCINGLIFIVIIDLRPTSPTFLKHISQTLDNENHDAYYIPPGFALGYQTLIDNSIIYYQMPEFYDPKFEAGFRWNDSAFEISWPGDKRIINQRDENYPDFNIKAVELFRDYYK